MSCIICVRRVFGIEITRFVCTQIIDTNIYTHVGIGQGRAGVFSMFVKASESRWSMHGRVCSGKTILNAEKRTFSGNARTHAFKLHTSVCTHTYAQAFTARHANCRPCLVALATRQSRQHQQYVVKTYVHKTLACAYIQTHLLLLLPTNFSSFRQQNLSFDEAPDATL